MFPLTWVQKQHIELLTRTKAADLSLWEQSRVANFVAHNFISSTTWFASQERDSHWLLIHKVIKRAKKIYRKEGKQRQNNSSSVIFSRKKYSSRESSRFKHSWCWTNDICLIGNETENWYRTESFERFHWWKDREQISPSEYRLSLYTRFVFHSIFIMFCLLHIVKHNTRATRKTNKRHSKKLEQ